jgi:hypothetical protein
MVFDRAAGWLAGLVPTAIRDAFADEHRALVDRFLDEAAAATGGGWKGPRIDSLPLGREILARGGADRTRVTLAAIAAMRSVIKARSWGRQEFVRRDGLVQLITQLLRGLEPSSAELMGLIRACAADNAAFFSAFRGGGGLFRLLEGRAVQPLDPGVAHELSLLASALRWSAHAQSADGRKLIARIERLASGKQEEVLKDSAWGSTVEGWLSGVGPSLAEKWMALLAHAAGATASEPSQRWIKETRRFSEEIGATDVVARILEWIEPLEPDPAKPEPNADLIKGMIWCIGMLGGERVPFALTALAERSFKKIPNIGARSAKLGNACLIALSLLPDAAGVAGLSRLKGKVRYQSAGRLAAGALQSLAERSGRSVEEIEELALPSFGLNEAGVALHGIDGFTAQVAIAGTDKVELRWREGEGRWQRGVPAALQKSAPDRVREVKRVAKEVESVLAGQVRRLEAIFLRQRSWPFDEWRQRYLRHPLLSGLTRRLIWSFETGDRIAGGIADGDRLVTADGEPIETDAATRVRLWHPIVASAAEVLQWRRRLESLDVVQPFKQAHREIYVLTDAERTTEVYSNRFAGHVLRQHQLRHLCEQRGWVYRLQGNFDSHNVPTRRLDWLDLSVEFWVDAVAEDRNVAIHEHVTTDQVRFVRTGGELEPLAAADPVVFSELMRDVDLFVSVTSVGNDPSWVDGGLRPFTGYWHEFAFGELNATAKTRRDVLQALLPRLTIADRCTLTERNLVLRGSLRTYKIHLGSANIMMEPNGQYLCIVPDRSASAREQSKLYLPFEGDAILSVILSKAFLLADDARITDPSILHQIRR